MKKLPWKSYILWILLAESAGGLSAWLTREGSKLFNTFAKQPPLSPPSIVFPIVWSILYLFMGISAARISNSTLSSARSQGLNLFILQLTINFIWSLIFFNAQAYGLAFILLLILWLLVFFMIRSFRKTDLLASKLQIPYLIWLTFAAYLSFGVWYLNR